MNDYSRLDFLKNRLHSRAGGNIAIVIRYRGKAVAGCTKVKDCDLSGGGFEKLRDDMMAQKPAAADHEDGTKL